MFGIVEQRDVRRFFCYCCLSLNRRRAVVCPFVCAWMGGREAPSRSFNCVGELLVLKFSLCGGLWCGRGTVNAPSPNKAVNLDPCT